MHISRNNSTENSFELLGYTDGTCPFDNNRYFDCPGGQGYYVLENGFDKSYRILQTNRGTGKDNNSDEEFGSAESEICRIFDKK